MYVEFLRDKDNPRQHLQEWAPDGSFREQVPVAALADQTNVALELIYQRLKSSLYGPSSKLQVKFCLKRCSWISICCVGQRIRPVVSKAKAKRQPILKLAREKMVLVVIERVNTSKQCHVRYVLTFHKSHASLPLPFRTTRRFDRKCPKWGTHDGNG